MKKKIIDFKDSFIDNFLLARVKFVSFIKEHKLLSSFIILFIISSIIAIIAFAQTTVLAKVTNVTITASDIESESSNDIENISSFSTISFNVGYVVDDFEEVEVTTVAPATTTKSSQIDNLQANVSSIQENNDLEFGKIVITGELDCGAVAGTSCSDLGFAWEQGDQSAVYSIENNKITVSIDNIHKGSHSQKIYLKIGNVKNGSNITAKFKVNNSEEKTKTLTIQSTPINALLPTVYSGPAQKVASNVRNAIFGLTLSLPSDVTSLKGLYINPEYNIILNSSQTGKDVLAAEVLTSEGSYGVYTTDLKYFNLPNGINSMYEESVYNSGKIDSIDKISSLEETPEHNSYKLKVTNITTDNNLIIKDGKILLGVYYLTVKSERDIDENSVSVKLEAENDIENVDNSFANIENKSQSLGNREVKIGIFEEKNDLDASLSPIETIAYGEDFISKTEFSHSKDSDDSINELIIEIPASEQYKLISYGNVGEEEEFYYVNGLSKEKNNYKVYYITRAPNGSEITYESYPVLEQNNQKLIKVRLVAKNVAPGSNIDFRLRYTLLAKNHAENVIVSAEADFGNNKLTAQSSAKITAFKIRGNVFIDDSDLDVVVDGANQGSSKISINPILSMPSALINSNLEGIGEINYVNVQVILPEGMKFIKTDENSNLSIKNNTASINIKNVKYNEWIEPIELEVGYDINIPNNTIKTITIKLQAYSVNNLYDLSSESYRTITRNIKYLNSEVIAHNQYAPVSNVAKNKAFAINTDLKNTIDTDKEIELITILPHNLASAEKAYYNGSYTLSGLTSNALCTKEQGISNFTSYSNWVSCDTYAAEKYKDVVAIKQTGNLAGNTSITYTFNIIPLGNNTGDEYHVNSTLLYSDVGSSNKVEKTLKTTSVSIVSKRITGTVWEDFNGDGIKQTAENPVADVKLSLYSKTNSGNELIDKTTSDTTGKYSFVDLKEGEYFVIAEFDNNKYGLSPMNATTNLSLASRFSNKVLDESSYYKFIWDKYNEYLNKEEILIEEVTDDKIVFNFKKDGKMLKGTINYLNGVLSYTNSNTNDDTNILLIEAVFKALCNLRGYDYNAVIDWFSNKLETNNEIKESGIYIKVDKASKNNIKLLEMRLDLANGIDKYEKNNEIATSLGKVVSSEDLKIESNSKAITNINLGLSLRKIYTVSIKKTISKVITTTKLGLVTTREFDNVSLAKIDVKDISNLSIKVVYNIELENTGFYPGYIFKVNDYIPDGMGFDSEDPLNKDWELIEDGYLINKSLENDLIYGGEKRHLTLALDIRRREAGSFINYASVEDADLQILGGVSYE